MIITKPHLTDASLDAPQAQTDTRLKREKVVRKLLTKYEKVIFSFFRELNLPLKFREIVRAYILASGGDTFFEASYNELTDLLFKRSATRLQANRETVRYHARALQAWQDGKKIELVRVVEKGRKINHTDGTTEYLKSKYELVLLDELVKVLYNCPSKEINARVKEAVGRMRDHFTPEEPKRQLPIRFRLERDVKTVLTKFSKAFEQAEVIKLNPVDYCQKLIFDLQATLDEIAAKREEKQRRERYISAFRVVITPNYSEAYECEGVEKDHLKNAGNEDGNLPPDNRTFIPLRPETDDVIESELYLNQKSDSVLSVSENPKLDAALHYARAGFPVFPLQNPIIEGGAVRCSCREWETCEKVGKHPRTRHGLKDATTDLELIRQWWRKWPNANVGLLTGQQAGIFVLDVDLKSGGDYSLNDLQDAYGELSPTLTARTGSGGYHFVFKYPDVRVKNSTSIIGSGLDVKSDNGYIVAPPSLHTSGRHYEWHGVNTPILEAPEWLIAVILLAEEDTKEGESTSGVTAPDNLIPLVRTETVREGQEFNTASGKSRGRHDYLFRYASGLVMSYSQEQVLARVQAKNLAACVPALPYADVVKLVGSAERYRPEQSRKAA